MTTYSADYLIIGNSAAGVSAAESIRSTDAEGSILVISKEPYPAYGRPLISYLIEGKTTEEKMAFKDDDFYEKLGIRTLLGPDFEATSLDPDRHCVSLENDQSIAYGKVLLATGSNPFTPPFKGYDSQENVHGFLTLDDAKGAWADVARATQAAHREGRKSRVVVIGGGLIGLKAAEALSHHADAVDVLEFAPRILPAVLDAQGAAVLQGLLENRGITCHPGLTADELLSEGDRITAARLTDGSILELDVLMLCVGVRPNSALAVDAGAQQGRGLLVGPDLQTTLPDVYAAGDLVQVTDALDGAQRPLALWPIALQHGRIAGLNMAGAANAPQFIDAFAVNAVDFFDISLLTAGLINPGEDSGCTSLVESDGECYTKFVTRDGMLVGYILLNRPDQAGIYTSLITDKVPLDTLEGDVFQAPPQNMNYPQDARWERLHKGYPSCLNELGWKE